MVIRLGGIGRRTKRVCARGRAMVHSERPRCFASTAILCLLVLTALGPLLGPTTVRADVAASADPAIEYVYPDVLVGSHQEVWQGFRTSTGWCGVSRTDTMAPNTTMIEREVGLDPATCSFTMEVAPALVLVGTDATDDAFLSSSPSDATTSPLPAGCLDLLCTAEHSADGWNGTWTGGSGVHERRCKAIQVVGPTVFVCPSTTLPVNAVFGSDPRAGDDAGMDNRAWGPTSGCTQPIAAVDDWGLGWSMVSFGWSHTASCSSVTVSQTATFSAVGTDTLACQGANVYLGSSLTYYGLLGPNPTTSWSGSADGPPACVAMMTYVHS
jgi:hypothetical protein